MIKILSGVEQADTGTIEFDGAPVTIAGTGDAIALGIATVYQEPQLFPELTVSENIFTGREIRRGGRVAWAEQNAKVVELLALLGLPARYATVPVGELSIAAQQQVSIAKSLAGDAKVLILDEPSAILTDAEIEVLFGVVRRLTGSGGGAGRASWRVSRVCPTISSASRRTVSSSAGCAATTSPSRSTVTRSATTASSSRRWLM
jgi:rhamnose transport system ATP-binding protein